MRRHIVNITIAIWVTSCGSSGSSGGDEDKKIFSGEKATTSGEVKEIQSDLDEETTAYTIAKKTTADLPACTEGNESQMAYVKDIKQFKSCENGVWENIEIDTGFSVVSVKTIGVPGVNYCGGSPVLEYCYFHGGQVVEYSNGSFMLNGTFSYAYISYSSGNTDSDINTVTGLFFTDNATLMLTKYLARNATDGYRTLWLLYDIVEDTASLLLDTNDNLVPDETDEVIYQLSITQEDIR